MTNTPKYFQKDEIYCGDAAVLIESIAPDSISASIWSPPYHVGKRYEADQTYEEWERLLRKVISEHSRILKPGGFLVVNIADILCFKDETMPRIQAANISRQRSRVTADDVRQAMAEHPNYNRRQIAAMLGCSEQTVDRRLHGNNIRGGKYATQTRVKIVGGIIEDMALAAGLYPYDRRIWVKDPAWANSRYASNSYRAVDEFEYVYIFWKPGPTTIDRSRLSKKDWTEWGSRAVWYIPSVRANDDHDAKFPIELPRRLIKIFTAQGDTVLDCFMGSGTTALAAIEMGRHFIGIEKESKYVALANNNIRKTVTE